MTKKDLTQKVIQETGQNPDVVHAVLDAAFAIILEEIRNGRTFKVKGFNLGITEQYKPYKVAYDGVYCDDVI